MKMRFHTVHAAAFAVACSGFFGPDPATLRSDIQARGARAVVADLYAHREQWDHFLRGVGSGSPEWLSVGFELRQGTDAGASSELGVAFFMALAPAPETVLRLLDRSARSEKLRLAPYQVCGDWVYIDYPENDAHALIEARLKTVQAVAAPELLSLRDECLRLLNHALASPVE
jgi:hypothetical protein